MPRHRKPKTVLPAYYFTEENLCVQSVIEDAFASKLMAEAVGARKVRACGELLRAGEKSLRVLAGTKAKSGVRCAAGTRAARKFWEAKVCARRILGGKP